MTIEEVMEKARAALPLGITEFHIVSGLHPDLPFSYYVDVIRSLKQQYPNIHIQAFTAVEIKYFADISGASITEVLQQLKEAGLGSLPGGGAEVFSDRLRHELCPQKGFSRRVVTGDAHCSPARPQIKCNHTLWAPGTG